MKTAVLFCLSVLSVCAAGKNAAVSVSPSVQWSANMLESPFGGASAWRIPDEAHWKKFWLQDLNRKPPATPDFTHVAVVIVSSGSRPTGGYRVEAVKAVKENAAWTIEFSVRKPAPDQFVTQALTCPVAVALFPRMDIFRPFVREVPPPNAPAS